MWYILVPGFKGVVRCIVLLEAIQFNSLLYYKMWYDILFVH